MDDTKTESTPATEELARIERAKTIIDHSGAGSECVHRHWAGGLLYSENVRLLADALNAHWLIDIIASHQRAIMRNDQHDYSFQVWVLKHLECAVDGEHFEVSAWTDTPGDDSHRWVCQRFGYTDFPLSMLPFEELWVEQGTLILKREH